MGVGVGGWVVGVGVVGRRPCPRAVIWCPRPLFDARGPLFGAHDRQPAYLGVGGGDTHHGHHGPADTGLSAQSVRAGCTPPSLQ